MMRTMVKVMDQMSFFECKKSNLKASKCKLISTKQWRDTCCSSYVVKEELRHKGLFRVKAFDGVRHGQSLDIFLL